MWARKQQPKEPEDDFYWEVELTPCQRKLMLDLIREGLPGATPAKRAALRLMETQVLGARRMNTALIRAHLDWAEIEAEARREGCSVPDKIWDRAKMVEP
jgi:hypothetical protein